MTLALLGFLASLLGAISGLGGGVLLKPLLDAFTGLDPALIDILSVCSVLSMACAALLLGRKQGEPWRKELYPLGFGAALGGLLGLILLRRLLYYIPNAEYSKALQNALLFLLLLTLLLQGGREGREQNTFSIGRGAALFLGLGLGLLSGFLGIGGGPLNMAALTLLLALPQRQAARHSLLMIALSQGTKLAGILFSGAMPNGATLSLLLPIIGAALLGGALGAKLSRYLSAQQLRRIYKGVLGFVLLTCFFNLLRILI